MLKIAPSRFQNNGTSVAVTMLVATHNASTDAVPIGTKDRRQHAAAAPSRPNRSVGASPIRRSDRVMSDVIGITPIATAT